MNKPIELIASAANWLSYATKTREDNNACLVPTEELFGKFYDAICYGEICEYCPHFTYKDTTEIVNVLYKPFK